MKANPAKDKFFASLVRKGRLKVSKAGLVMNLVTGKQIGFVDTGNGYVYIELKDGDTARRIGVHRLVWLTHKGLIPDGMVPNHKDSVRTNNKLTNLELTTYSGNVQHAYDSGRSEATREHCRRLGKQAKGKRGIELPWSKLSMTQVRSIRRKYVPRVYTVRKLAKEFDMPVACIHAIISNTSYGPS